MSEPNHAIFLSYASEDADAALRICTTLRSAGIEVWLDQSDLKGGDAWDAAIKRQIKACALFIPIISANTRTRVEGYFRLEWKLAVDRSHLIAPEKAFLLPVVIDGTNETEALVPDKFRDVHWTRLPGGETPPWFLERVSRLLTPNQARSPAPRAAAGLSPDATRPSNESALNHVSPPDHSSIAKATVVRTEEGGVPRVTHAAIPVRRLLPWTLAAAVLLLAGLGALQSDRRHRYPLPEKKTIVLADFANSTGDPVFDDTLRQGMIVQLEQSPLLSLVSEQRIQATLRLMGQRVDARLTPALGGEVCERTGSAAVLDGSIASLGSKYVLGVHATNCSTGEVLDTEQVQVVRKEDVLEALSQVASRFRTRVGESLASVSKLDTPLAEATTSSLEALKAFSEAHKIANSKGSAAALPLVRRATELDPEFAIAHAYMGRLYGDVGQEILSAESTAEAYKFRDRASERERFWIIASYEIQVAGNLEKAEQTCLAWRQIYPGEMASLGFPAGLILRVFGRYEEGTEKAKKLIEMEPDSAMWYHLLVINDIALGRFKEAQEVLDNASPRNLDIPQFSFDRYELAFLKGDQAAMKRLSELAARDPAADDFVARLVASSLAYSGHLRQAQEVSQRAVNLAEQSGRQDVAARFQGAAALREAFFGNTNAAARLALAALELSTGRESEYGAALALALAQVSMQPNALADDLGKRFPEDTAVRFHYVPAIRARAALNRNDPATAIELLRISAPYELGSPKSSFSGFPGVLYTVYVRGQAYLAMHRGAEAAAEFQKILHHPGLIVSDPIGALARLQLGRAYALSDDKARARAAYAEFLDLWKTADSDIPIFKAATVEYAQLQ